jgi:hypothetical protein
MKRLRRHRAALLAPARAPRRSRLFALDVSTWRTTVVRDDLRFRALPNHTALWTPATLLPGDPAAKLIGTSSRRIPPGTPVLRYSRIGSNPRCARTRRRCAPWHRTSSSV